MIYDLSNPLQHEQFETRVAMFLKKDAGIVELTERKGRRTLNQNALLHLWLGYFGTQTGNELEYVKRNYYKYLCNKDLFLREKEDPYIGKIRYLRSSRELDKDEFSLSMDRFRNWASSEGGIYLPTLEETDLINQMEIEIQRDKAYL